MRAVFPGRPQAELQAVSTAFWDGQRIVAYISGNAIVILGGPNELIQTIYHDENSKLTAITVNEISGEIAACTESTVHLYTPIGKNEGGPRWSLKDTLKPKCNDKDLCCLSWGIEQELLIGGSSLTLFSSPPSRQEYWTKVLSSRAKCAAFSHDSGFVASIGHYDRMVKIWRDRTSGGSKERFDVAYLQHPATVTSLQWRKEAPEDHHAEHILFTTCSDNKLRVWASMDHHSLQMLDLWAELDLKECIQPRAMPDPSEPTRRFAFVIDSATFLANVKSAASLTTGEEREKHNRTHLVEVAERGPDVVVILDDRGNMSAWGLERVGCKARQQNDIFNLAHAEDLDLHLFDDAIPDVDCSQLCSFPGSANDGLLNVLVHLFDGRIEWFCGTVDKLFDPAAKPQRLRIQASWTGHAEPIERLVRTTSGKALVSRTSGTEANLWIHGAGGVSGSLMRRSVIEVEEEILRSYPLKNGDYVLTLHPSTIILWDTRILNANSIATCKYNLDHPPLCLMLLPQSNLDAECAYVATVTSNRKGIVWKASFNEDASDSSLEEFASFVLDGSQPITFFRPVDPAGLTQAESHFFDTFANDVAVSITSTGALSSWTAKVDAAKAQVYWLSTAYVETSIENPSLVSGTSIRKAAVVDSQKSVLTIWDTRGGLLEYTEQYGDHETIQDLDWTSTPDNQSVLAVGFPHKVLIYVQLRYDYMDAGPSWTPIRTIDIAQLTTLPIADSIWLGNGEFAVAAGHQLFLYGRLIELPAGALPDHNPMRRGSRLYDLFDVVSRLNGPLPVYHPQFLSQCILAGKLRLAHQVLFKLYKILKFYTAGDDLDVFLGIHPEDFVPDADSNPMDEKRDLHSSLQDLHTNGDLDDEVAVVSEEIATSLSELISDLQLPQLSSQQQLNLLDIIECVGMVEKHERSIDDHASRYLAFFRQYSLTATHTGSQQFQILWREITWAYHSSSQDILVDLTSRHYNNRMLWKHARGSGIFMWMTDAAALRDQFETIARNEYTKTDEKNPIDCSLYYLALKKKAVLIGLWRMASWNREQGATQRLLANNFSDPRWQTAALKNAYALMGKRRFEYAAAFFLLADKLQDAVGILASRLGDIQLAIAVARIYEGDNGPVLKSLLEEKVLPQAAREGDRWMANWAFWMLNRRDMALRALIEPLHGLLDIPGSPALESRLYLTDDPALVVLYKRLRDKSLQTLRGALQLPPTAEWDLVVQSARLYQRMGCDILALDLVRNWEFLQQPSPLAKTKSVETPIGNTPDPKKLLRRRSSLVVADLPTALTTESNGSPVMKAKQPPTVIEEPSANSILDSFDF